MYFSVLTSERSEESESSERTEQTDTEGEGPSEPMTLNEIELVFKPHPTEMSGDNALVKALKENSIRWVYLIIIIPITFIITLQSQYLQENFE